MNQEKAQRRQSLRIIISETIMFISVILTVIVLALIVSGYWINADFKVERQGMLQISSVPSGANVEIDGESSWLQRTNTSKVLSSGEHSILLTKEGYDSWTKTINISEGLLYRIHYPRLFLKNRVTEKVLNAEGVISATISPDRNYLLLLDNTTKWRLINLNSEKIEAKTIDISKLFSGVSLAENAEVGLFTDEVVKTDWDQDSSHILIKSKHQDSIEWILLDVKNPEKSINISKEFGSDFNEIRIFDNSSSNLLAIRNHNLHRIDVSSRSISAILVKDVLSFDFYHNEVVFSAVNPSLDLDKDENCIGYFRIGDEENKILMTTNEIPKVVISQFYDEKYITVLESEKLSVYKENGFEEQLQFNLGFVPENLKVGHNGEFILAYKDKMIATLDMEANSLREWEIDDANFNWLDNDMLYTISGSELIVYDYDGLNRRIIANNVSSHIPTVSITDDRWLYYFSDDNLMREWLIPR